jgi:putative addiction module antidote
MNKPLIITRIGNLAGIVSRKDVLARLHVGPGDVLYLTEAPDGVRLMAVDLDFAAKMDAAERIMRENHDILRELARC